MTNLDKEITNIKTRKAFTKSFISEEEKKELLEKKVTGNDLPKETVGNIILNCISMVPVESKLDGFYSNAIAQILFGTEREIEFNEKFKKFLSSHLEKSIIKMVKKGDKEEFQGLYSGWVISQVLEELGEKFD